MLLLDSGDLRTLDLAAAGSIRFADPKLQAQLKDYLTIVNQSRSLDKRSIYIDSSSSKERQIEASYMIHDAGVEIQLSSGVQGQGRADARGLGHHRQHHRRRLDQRTLVGGVRANPVSFISKLYEPKSVPRQTVELPEDRAAEPVVYQAGLGGGIRGEIAVGSGVAPPPPSKRCPSQLAWHSASPRAPSMDETRS